MRPRRRKVSSVAAPQILARASDRSTAALVCAFLATRTSDLLCVLGCEDVLGQEPFAIQWMRTDDH
jgi:hypothetical protein